MKKNYYLFLFLSLFLGASFSFADTPRLGYQQEYNPVTLSGDDVYYYKQLLTGLTKDMLPTVESFYEEEGLGDHDPEEPWDFKTGHTIVIFGEWDGWVVGADPKTFQEIPGLNSWGFDKNFFFCQHMPMLQIPQDTMLTYTILSPDHVKIEGEVFFAGCQRLSKYSSKLENLGDVTKNSGYFRDGEKIYAYDTGFGNSLNTDKLFGVLMTGTDAKSFLVATGTLDDLVYDAYDKHQYYLEGEAIVERKRSFISRCWDWILSFF